MSRSASEAQIRFLHAWRKDARQEARDAFAEHLKEQGEGDLDSLSMHGASTIISLMVANFGEPHKPGKDDLRGGGNGEGRGNGQGQGEGENRDGEGEGYGDGDGEGQGEGQGENNQEGDGNDEMENNYRDGSKEKIIAEALIKHNLDREKAYQEIKDQIGQKPLEFTQNIGGGREPLPLGSDFDPSSERTQKGRTRKTINDVARALKQQKKDGKGDKQQQGGGGKEGGEQEDDAIYVIKKITHGQIIWAEQNAEGEPAKDVGMRPAIYGAKMLNAGFPAKMILDAIMMDWPKEIRRSVMDKDGTLKDALAEYKRVCGKPDDKYVFDITKLWKQEQQEHMHPAVPSITRLVESGVPTMQVGGHGTGKTHIAENVNQLLNEKRGTDYGFGVASMTAGTSPGEFKGRITLDGFLPSLFEDIFTNGGVFLFDELDAGEANLLTLLNSALANGYFVNNRGQKLTAHEHFMPMAAGNTMGLGANRKYVGRNRLDAATLDRWVKVRVEFSKELESKLYWDIISSKQD